MTWWRRNARVEELAGRIREPSDTGGRQARERAERDLEKTRRETVQYAELGREVKTERMENGLAMLFARAAATRGQHG